MEDLENKKKILICGGGIGGFALGQYLRQHRSKEFHFDIIEKDVEFSSRKQGYSLTIQKNGQKVLELIDKLKDFEECVKKGIALKGRGQSRYSMCDGSLISQSNEQKKDLHYYIPRQEVRRILLEGIESNVKWGYWVNSFTVQEDEKIEVYFGCQNQEINPKKETYDCLVNCEGLYSRIRTTLLGKEDLVYLETIMINGIIQNTDGYYKENRSYIYEGDKQIRLFLKPYQKGKLMWQLTVSVNLEQANSISKQSPSEQLNYSLKCLEKIKDQPIYNMIQNTSLDLIRCGLLQTREPLTAIDFASFQSVTFLGDSAHPMPPFKGQGANQALEDAADLGRIITPDRIPESLRVFERSMFKRANYYQEESVSRVKDFHESKDE
ncbi:hypothetical protein ABPG72_017379 [Tetrahymena utriculariae]